MNRVVYRCGHERYEVERFELQTPGAILYYIFLMQRP